MNDFSALEKSAYFAIKHGIAGMCVAPPEIVKLLEELKELRKFKALCDRVKKFKDDHCQSAEQMFPGDNL